MNEVKKFQNVLLNYKFNGAKFYLGEVIGNGSASLFTLGTIEFDNQHEHTLLTSLKQQGDALLTTELIDEKNNLYMYMIENTVDPSYANDNGNTINTFTAEFSGYDWVAEFDCGELNYVKLNGGKYTKTLSAGYAVYLIPLK